MIVLVDELVLSQCFVECLPEPFVEVHGGWGLGGGLFHKDEVDGADDEQEGQDVVPVQMGALKHDVGYDAEDGQRDALLYDLQLYKVEGTAVFYEAHAVGRHLAAIFR